MLQARAPAPPQPYTKAPGTEPLPGYVLLEPLGRGGFGEVWKCEAPGGLHKAIKFVSGDTDSITSDSAQLSQEFEAFQQVKAIRHPFLLTLERVELIGNELVMVMELADRQLGDRFSECQQAGLPGIPRDELVGYLREAAEALDMISAKYGLQHLDVKPANLFLLAGHVKVGDYGLVSKLDAGSGKSRGLTPRYAAPEVMQGQVHTQSDQYSLALVYHELLTGTFPFAGRTAQQLMLQHVSLPPDLSALADYDQPVVGLALQKRPEDRFASCEEFVRVLAARPVITPEMARSLLVTPAPRAPGLNTGTLRLPGSSGAIRTSQTKANDTTRKNIPAPTPPATPAVELPRFTTPRPSSPLPLKLPDPTPAAQARPAPPRSRSVQLEQLLSVVPLEWLVGQPAPNPDRSSNSVVRTIMESALGVNPPPRDLRGVTRLPDGSWTCRFLTTMDPRVAQVKLDLLWEEGGVAMDSRDPGRVVFRQDAPEPAPASTGLFGSFGKKSAPQPAKSGLEVVVELPQPGSGVGEVVVTGNVFGTPPPEFIRNSERSIVKLIEGVRRELNNFQERRKHPRVPAAFPLTLYPLHSDGRVDSSFTGRCKDISEGGLAFTTKTKPSTRHFYAAFDDIPQTAGIAILIQLVRYTRRENDVLVTGRYRLDLVPNLDEK